MNLGDKTRSVTIRLTPQQYEYLERSARALEVTPSRFLRMVVNATMLGAGMAETSFEQAKSDIEHAEADLHNLMEH